MSVGRLAATAGAEFWRHAVTGSSTGAAHIAPAARSSARRVITAGAAASRESSWELDTVDDYRMTGMNPFRMAGAVGALALSCAVVSTAPFTQQPPAAGPARSAWAAWSSQTFRSFSSVIDGGRAGAGFPAKNLTPRGLVLNLGRGYWVGFDTDLLSRRGDVARHGRYASSARAGSYIEADRKTPGGQSPAPEPDGKVWLANGIYPGGRAARHQRSTIRASRRRAWRKSAAAPCPKASPASRRFASSAAALFSNTPCAAPTSASG